MAAHGMLSSWSGCCFNWHCNVQKSSGSLSGLRGTSVCGKLHWKIERLKQSKPAIVDLRHWPWCMQGQRRESLQLIPGAMHSQDVVLDAAGDWLMQCRTTNHYDNGMSVLLAVAPSGTAYSTLLQSEGNARTHS